MYTPFCILGGCGGSAQKPKSSSPERIYLYAHLPCSYWYGIHISGISLSAESCDQLNGPSLSHAVQLFVCAGF